MRDILTIPTAEARLALDMVSTGLMLDEDEGIALSDSNDYNRLHNIYNFHGIKSRFSQMVLDAAKAEGRRMMFMRQPIHVRIMSTQTEDTLLSFKSD